jgi:hypothetical protein
MYWCLNSGLCSARQMLCYLSHTSSSFGDWVSSFVQTSLDCDSPILSFPILRMTGVPHHAQLFSVEVESHKLLVQAGLELWSS